MNASILLETRLRRNRTYSERLHQLSLQESGYVNACEFTTFVLRRHKIHRPAVPVDDIIRSYGIHIVETHLGKRVAMMNRMTRTIFIRPMNGQRKRFYLAHELGHFLLPEEFHEYSHNTFASCLLMPHHWMLSDLKEYSEAALCDRYGVTHPVLKIRMEMLKAFSTVQSPF